MKNLFVSLVLIAQSLFVSAPYISSPINCKQSKNIYESTDIQYEESFYQNNNLDDYLNVPNDTYISQQWAIE